MNLNKRYSNREIWMYINDKATMPQNVEWPAPSVHDLEIVFIPKGSNDKRKFKSKSMRFGKKKLREIIVASKLPQGEVPRSFLLHIIFKDGTEEKIRLADGELIMNSKN